MQVIHLKRDRIVKKVTVMELYGGADGALGSRIGVPDRN